MVSAVDEDLSQQALVEIDAEWETQRQRGQYALDCGHHYLLDGVQLDSIAKLKPDFLVENAIPRQGITFVVGKPGAKKSWLCYDLGMAILDRRPWLGLDAPDVPEDAIVLALNFDQPASECARRFKRLGHTGSRRLLVHSIGVHRPPAPLPPVLHLPLAFEPLEAIVEFYRPSLIITDSLRQAHTADESDSMAMAEIIAMLRRLTFFGSTIMVVHHLSRAGNMRGSTEIEAGADAVIEVDTDIITWKKTRGWEIADPAMPFKLEDDGDATYLRGGRSLVHLLAKQGPMTISDIAVAMGVSEPLAKVLVDKLRARNAASFELDARTSKRVVTLTSVKKAA